MSTRHPSLPSTKRAAMTRAARLVQEKLATLPEGATARDLQTTTKVPMHVLRVILSSMLHTATATAVVRSGPLKRPTHFYTLSDHSR